MAIDKVVAPLLRVPLFAGLKPLQITEIGRQAERISFRPGSTITQAGTQGDGAFLIVSGNAMRTDPPPQPVEPGSLVGELAMLTEHAFGATVVAEGRVHALKITRAALHDQMRADQSLADHFTRLLADRLSRVAAEMRSIDQMLAAIAAADGALATRHGAGESQATAPDENLSAPSALQRLAG